jgi:Protein of unknown function (DUF3572)
LTESDAQDLAIRALSWLSAQEELWPGFLNASGVDMAGLRQAAAEPEFLAGVLGYLTQDDGWIAAFCDAEGYHYAAPMAARRALAGGEAPEWT